MADGYGFGGEGDWKTCALVRAMKVMAADLKGGTSFMEDYTYHLHPDGHLVLGAHMLEICESIAEDKPRWKFIRWASAVRKIRFAWFSMRRPDEALNASIIDLGNRFRLIVNEVDAVKPPEASAEVARCSRRLEMSTRFQDCLCGVDLCGGRPSHGFQLCRHNRAPGRFRGNRGNRISNY